MVELENNQTIEDGYQQCVTVLSRTAILTPLTNSNSFGVIGIDGKEYPIPTREQVVELFDRNKEYVSTKVSQGFNRIELVPLAMPISHMADVLKAAIRKHAAEGEIYRTRRIVSDPLIPVRINKEKQVWLWEALFQAITNEELIYFPQKYTNNHWGQTKLEVINNKSICAIPGWSVGLVESLSFMPGQGNGQTLGGRRQLETGFSPREYLQILHNEDYEGETGKTIEDFMIKFLTHLETTNEVSNDRYDNNSMWCLGQYIKLKFGECVPTGWWHRDFGRLRLDMHRTGNKLCTASWGGTTTVRLV